MNILSHSTLQMRIVKPQLFHGVDITDGAPSAVRDLPVDHRVICGITFQNGDESLFECADLSEMQAIYQRFTRLKDAAAVNWYVAPSADCLQEIYERNCMYRAPVSLLDKLGA
jgi:hypothetical protein